MGVQIDRGRHVVQFEFRGKRVHRRCPAIATREEAQALELRLRRAMFASMDLGAPAEHAHELADHGAGAQWLTIANMLLAASSVQPRPGVYFLCQAGRLVYVGQSRNVARRLAGHHEKGYDRAVMIELPIAELTATEAYLIKMLRPPLNRSAGRGAGGGLRNDARAQEAPAARR